MKSIPVTPELLVILSNAMQDSIGFIEECEESLPQYTESNGVKNALILGIERRKQLLAITKDLIKRFS